MTYKIQSQHGCYPIGSWCYVTQRESLADAVEFYKYWGSEYRVVDDEGNVIYPPDTARTPTGGNTPESEGLLFRRIHELESRVAELEEELKVSNILLKEHESLLDVLPPCPAHGECIPHAIAWVQQMKELSAIIGASSKPLA